MKKYNGFEDYWYNSNQFDSYLNNEMTQEEALRSAATEFQYLLDGYSNQGVIETLVEKYKD